MDKNYIEFSRFLLDTWDLDPLYPIVVNVIRDEKVLKRFLLAYWIFYSAGVAAHIAEAGSKLFYAELCKGNESHYPRGHERRHLRGEGFANCMDSIQAFGCPEKVVDFMIDADDFQSISTRVQSFCGFGPWISWKIADMTDRVVYKYVDFSTAELGMYKDPVKGAALVKFGDQKHPILVEEVHEVVEWSLRNLSNYKSPPFDDRPLNVQEIETCLCKYKSYINGHYPYGNDTKDIYEGLDGWGDLADALKLELKPYHDTIMKLTDGH